MTTRVDRVLLPFLLTRPHHVTNRVPGMCSCFYSSSERDLEMIGEWGGMCTLSLIAPTTRINSLFKTVEIVLLTSSRCSAWLCSIGTANVNPVPLWRGRMGPSRKLQFAWVAIRLGCMTSGNGKYEEGFTMAKYNSYKKQIKNSVGRLSSLRTNPAVSPKETESRPGR